MHPDKMITLLQSWIESETKKKHLMAVKYIEENIDLIDTDLQKFMDDCPTSCKLEVYEMLLKAGVDMKDYVINGILKKWDNYIHDANPQFQQYYTVDYEEKLDKYITETIKWNSDWRHDAIVLDTIPAIEEA